MVLTKVIGLDTHIKDIFQVMEYDDLNNVILVGHSYRGPGYRRRSRKDTP